MQGLVNQNYNYPVIGIGAGRSSTHQAMQCLARMQRLERRVTCGVSPLVRLARAGRGDMLTRGLDLGPSEGVPKAHNAFTQAMGDGNSLNKAECMLVIGDAKGEGRLEVVAAASASNSAGGDSNSKGEEGCWLVTGAPLTVTSRGMSGQGAGAQEAASKGPASESEEGLLKESDMEELPPTVSAARADGTRSGMAVGGMKQ